MNNFPRLTVELMTSNWVRIENAGGGSATYNFLHANRRHMDVVCFGNHPAGDLAIKSDRLDRFVGHARKNGMRVFWKHNGAELGA